jgi:uncharacterized protein (TIGR00251 family)
LRPKTFNYAILKVRVQPRASKNEIVGWHGGVLRIRLTAPPVEGAANKACRDFLAEALGVKRGDVELALGQKLREKLFRIMGLTEEELHRRIQALLVVPKG